MKVECITNKFNLIEKNCFYEASVCGDFYNIRGLRYEKKYFEVAEKSLTEQLEDSKNETARIQKLIDEQTPKVGDKYLFAGTYTFKNAVMMVSKQTNESDGILYSLVIIECPNYPSYVGEAWGFLKKDINQIFGFSNPKNFTKIA